MLGLMKYEFLLPLGNGTHFDIDLYMEKILFLEMICDNNYTSNLLLEKDALQRMIEDGCFPSEKSIIAALQRQGEEIYNAKNIARVVNKIISYFENNPQNYITHDGQWGKFNITPPLEATSLSRKSHVQEILLDALPDIFFKKIELSSLYYSTKTHPPKNIKLTAEATYLYPSYNMIFPLDIEAEIPLHYDFHSFFSLYDTYDLYTKAKNDFEIKLSLYFGAIKLISTLGNNAEIKWGDFELGSEFSNSLREYQCHGNGKFSSVTYTTITHILANAPKNEINYFRKSVNSIEPIQKNGSTAFRTHITSGHEGLRLMLWKKPDQTITLANVGNKFDLVIH